MDSDRQRRVSSCWSTTGPSTRHDGTTRPITPSCVSTPGQVRAPTEMLSALLGDGADLHSAQAADHRADRRQALLHGGDGAGAIRSGHTCTQRSGECCRPLAGRGLRSRLRCRRILASRIDRLPTEEKELLQTLAVIGREFPLGLSKAVVNAKADDELERMLAELQRPSSSTSSRRVTDIEYIFKHALTQEVAYNSLLVERRKLLHERAGQAVEIDVRRAVGRSSRRNWPIIIATAITSSKAVEYLGASGPAGAAALAPMPRRSVVSSAAIDLLQGLPDSPERTQRELLLQLALGPALIAVKGWAAPEVEQA